MFLCLLTLWLYSTPADAFFNAGMMAVSLYTVVVVVVVVVVDDDLLLSPSATVSCGEPPVSRHAAAATAGEQQLA